MFIKKALIISKHQKTDDELKAIMATHPEPGVYGFYKMPVELWESREDQELLDYWKVTADAFWCENGVSSYERDRKWIIEDLLEAAIDRIRRNKLQLDSKDPGSEPSTH